MKYAVITLLILTCTGCAVLHEHALGTRVHSFTIKGHDYVHCSVLMDKAKQQEAHDAIEVCRDEYTAMSTTKH